MSWNVLILSCCIVSLMFTVDLGESCSCRFDHPQNSFCRADFAIHATVRSNVTDVDEIIGKYKVDITRIFKGEFSTKKGAFIYTPKYDSLCAVYLGYRNSYLLVGRMNNGKPQISRCGWIEEWNALPEKIIESLGNGGYNCSCAITACTNKRICIDENDEDSCVTETECDNDGNEYCHMINDGGQINEQTKRCRCEHEEEGNCVWDNTLCADDIVFPEP